MLALIVALTLSGGTCSVDADCVVMQRCSCECCPREVAMNKQEAEAERRRCSTLGPCSKEECSGSCPMYRPWAAVCRYGNCTLVRKDTLKDSADAGR